MNIEPTGLARGRAALALAIALAAAAATPALASAIVFPPAGSNSFIQLYEIDSGQHVCQPLCSFASSLGTDVTLPPFSGASPGAFINATGEVSAGAIHSSVAGNVAVEYDLAFNDTYTVHGGGGPFAITATMQVDGTGETMPFGRNFALISGAVVGSIGQFDIDPAEVGIPEVLPFDATTRVTDLLPFLLTSTPSSTPINFTVSYTRIVTPGDVFDLGYELSSGFAVGGIDLSHTATISFATPDGVFLTDTAGNVFGNPPVTGPAGAPEPSAWALMILGFFGLGASARRRRAESAA